MGAEYICQYPSDEEIVCGGQVHDQKDIVFTGKGASELLASSMQTRWVYKTDSIEIWVL